MGIEPAGAELHLGGEDVVGLLHVACNGKAIERVHGPRALQQTPILVARLIAEPRLVGSQ